MIEFTFMGRRYGLFAARLTQLGMLYAREKAGL